MYRRRNVSALPGLRADALSSRFRPAPYLTAIDRRPPMLMPGNGRILIVEDDPSVRRMLAEYLGAHGFDLGSHQLVGADGREVSPTGMEFDLLKAFVEWPNQVLNRDPLLTLTRNREWEPFDRSIDIRIARVRRKVEAEPERPQAIRTIRGTGTCTCRRAMPSNTLVSPVTGT